MHKPGNDILDGGEDQRGRPVGEADDSTILLQIHLEVQKIKQEVEQMREDVKAFKEAVEKCKFFLVKAMVAKISGCHSILKFPPPPIP